ncbi:cell wall biogenesis [Fusarium longipes]|uniref:Cell wall biogenesis n=1 Tax=Fusarium longipes TaxID=694270 RepID=A0A395SBV5_9HYPO|nr:cell wall biogenesis [Fusarium longipes]
MDYESIATPEACYVDFCLLPVSKQLPAHASAGLGVRRWADTDIEQIGTGNVSVAEDIAEVQRVLKASGLKYTLHSAGTTVEGSWDEVMAAVGKAHAAVHRRGVVRIQSSMRVGSRTDKMQTAEDKVKRLESLLASQSE